MIETRPFDAAAHLTSEEARNDFLVEALDTGDAKVIAHAVGILARARGMVAVAADTGKHRQALYRSLSSDGNPRLDTFFAALNALGLKLTVAG